MARIVKVERKIMLGTMELKYEFNMQVARE